MFILLIFLISAAALTVLLWAGTLFFQGYVYTEPTEGIHWQAPAAGAALAVFFTLWCLIIVNAADPVTQDIPYDTLFRFSPTVEKYQKPVKEIWVELKTRNSEGEVVKTEVQKFELEKQDRTRVRYKPAGTQGSFPRGSVTKADGKVLSETRVEAIIIKNADGESRFEPIASPSGEYRQFQDADGWTMRVTTDGPTGIPVKFRWGRFLGNLLLNFLHFAIWFVCLWLLLRFQWGHALGLSVVMWIVLTLAILPLLFEQSAAQARRNALTNVGVRHLPDTPLAQVADLPGKGSGVRVSFHETVK